MLEEHRRRREAALERGHHQQGRLHVFNVKTEALRKRTRTRRKRQSFEEKYDGHIRHWAAASLNVSCPVGMLRRWDDSQAYLSDHPDLVCEETASALVHICIDLELEQKHALMAQVNTLSDGAGVTVCDVCAETRSDGAGVTVCDVCAETCSDGAETRSDGAGVTVCDVCAETRSDGAGVTVCDVCAETRSDGAETRSDDAGVTVCDVCTETRSDGAETRSDGAGVTVCDVCAETRSDGAETRSDGAGVTVCDVCAETRSDGVTVCDMCAETRSDGAGKHALMAQVAHQAIVLKFILDMAETFRTADQMYLDAFDKELELLKQRVQSCAHNRREVQRREKEGEEEDEEEEEDDEEEEEEQRQRRLGPGGLDPQEVYQSLPQEMQRGFDEKNLELLHRAMDTLQPEEAKYHLRRCIDSGLWVPESHEEEEDTD
ncbi:hypothetical protein WMY93_006010 [Mugilogobius chulae]|uniref:Hsp90 chaperone protein kinase-targeting subunit n=1 Tax=Mugilogobius chulae TaxID=88201 RepID=A0AAW0PIW5_9GOBI